MEEQGGHHARPLPARPQQRQPEAAGVVTGDEVEVELEIDTEPRVVVEPADFARALDADPGARTAYDRLSYNRKREHVLAIENAKKAETRTRLIEKALATLRDQEAAGGRAARAETRGDHP
jgi:Bacteriocin-protection, YdeI or OmpD-Associated